MSAADNADTTTTTTASAPTEQATALLSILDAMPQEQRAAVATEIVGVLLGRPVDLSTSPASTASHDHEPEGATS
ncbi:hypothetical protein GCM10009721_06250 [Terrabacter tumescens]|uniref:Uncharacterized protein n=1 Tax=Terrabacter tumescens TaxID=60443 RepID=A0ABQ2HN07_9MICO|nr:hypothetical protein [Terrabacter tumescens]GGM84254.1 hypothetical protein GCM10009721_06250 [Terrabacter tumescens]